MRHKVAIVSSGLGAPSSTELLADAISEQLADFDTVHHQLRDHARAIADALVGEQAPDELDELVREVVEADAMVLVTPTKAATYAGLAKCFIDLLEPGTLLDLPVMLAATACSGRHALMVEHTLRPLFHALGARPLQQAVFAAADDFDAHGVEGLRDSIWLAAQELGEELRAHPPRALEKPADNVVELRLVSGRR